MLNDKLDPNSTSLQDVKQLGFFASIASLSYVFWICGGMELVERLAYYGVRQMSALYATEAASKGGLGITATELGNIFLVWAIIQTWVPFLTGGLSDRIGYKETIFLSTILKITGYLVMANFASYWGFMAAAAIVAFGTGIFKPGIQGTIVKATNRQNSSMAWGVFYQTVNIGGWIGIVIAAQLRQYDWSLVFYGCAGVIALNLLLLATYTEPGKEERLERINSIKNGDTQDKGLLKETLKALRNPVILWYILLFSGFWFSLYALWDVGSLYIRDWVDSRPLITALFGADGTQSSFFIFILGLNKDGLSMQPEGLIGLNYLVIMLTCFIVAGLGAKLRATTSMYFGTFLASAALLAFGGFNSIWIIVAAIICFSLGEMLSSPKSSEFLGNIAPSHQKAMFLGFTQVPIGFGWVLESKLAPTLYDLYGAKETVARQALEKLGLNNEALSAIPNGEAFDHLVTQTGLSADALTAQLYAANSIGTMWYIVGIVGLISALGMFTYGRWTYRMVINERVLQPAM